MIRWKIGEIFQIHGKVWYNTSMESKEYFATITTLDRAGDERLLASIKDDRPEAFAFTLAKSIDTYLSHGNLNIKIYKDEG